MMGKKIEIFFKKNYIYSFFLNNLILNFLKFWEKKIAKYFLIPQTIEKKTPWTRTKQNWVTTTKLWYIKEWNFPKIYSSKLI